MRGLYRKAFIDSLPVMMGYTTMGFAAGVLLSVAGKVSFPAAWSGFLAATSISGTLQFVVVDWFANRSPLLHVALITAAISFRYGFYGFSLLNRWRGIALWKKLYLIWGLTDETYAIESSCAIEDKEDYIRYCLTLTALDHSYWIIGTTVGAIVGSSFTLPSRGIEFSMVALFIAIFTDQVRGLVKGGAK